MSARIGMYAFNVRGFGYVEQWAETRSKARYKLWLRFSEAYPCTFREFMEQLEPVGAK